MRQREVEEAGPDAALGLNENPVTHIGMSVQIFAEPFLAAPAAIDVRMVEKVDAGFQAGIDQLFQFGGIEFRDTHTAERDGRGFESTVAEIDAFHEILPFTMILF